MDSSHSTTTHSPDHGQAVEANDAVVDQQRCKKSLQLLQKIVSVTNAGTELTGTLQTCLNHLCAATGWNLAHAYLQEVNVPNSFIPSGIGYSNGTQQYDALRAVLNTRPLEAGRGAAGCVAATGKLVWIADLAAEPDVPYADVALAAGVKSACAFPLAVGSRVVGIVEMFSTQPQEPDAVLQELLAVIGLQLGPAVEHMHVTRQLHASQAQMHAILDNCPGAIYVKDTRGQYLLVNRVFEQWFRVDRTHIIGKTDYALAPKEIADQWRENDRNVIMSQKSVEEEETALINGEMRTYFSIKFPLRDTDGVVYASCGITTDITDRKRTEEDQRRLQEEVIRLQQATLEELSTPLIPISNRVVIMPLIGAMDSLRAQQVVDTVLHGVETHHANIVIVDVTGVAVVDTKVAATLINLGQSVRLLGARLLLTGIRPEVAQTLVSLGVNFSSIVTMATLQSGIMYAQRLVDGGAMQGRMLPYADDWHHTLGLQQA